MGVAKLNIIYNREITEDQIKLFKLMEEFTYTRLKNKSLFYKITLRFNEAYDRSNGLSYIGRCTFRPSQPFQPIIKISDYAAELYSKAYILSGKKLYDSYEKYRYHLIFHELAHVVRTYNDPEQFRIMTTANEEIFDKAEEDSVNGLADEFLKIKGII